MYRLSRILRGIAASTVSSRTPAGPGGFSFVTEPALSLLHRDSSALVVSAMGHVIDLHAFAVDISFDRAVGVRDFITGAGLPPGRAKQKIGRTVRPTAHLFAIFSRFRAALR